MDPFQNNSHVNASAWVLYFHVGTLSVLIWDIANRVKSDYNLLVSDFCVKTFLYLLSRTMTFLYTFTKVLYFTMPMSICAALDHALSASYLIAVFATLSLATIHLVLLLDRKQSLVIAMFASCALVVGGNAIFPIGVSGKNQQPPQSGACQDFAHDYVAAAFILLWMYHAIMLSILTLAARQSVSDDRENLTTQERYSRASRRSSMMLAASKRPSSDHYVFYILTTVLSLAMTIWFLAARRSSGSFRLIPVVVYLVCGNITLGRVLRANKRLEKELRVAEALSLPIKFDMPRPDINDTLASYQTTRTLVLDNNSQDTQCDVAGLFQADSPSCIPPVVEIEVNKVVQSKHDYSTDFRLDNGR